MLMQWGQHHVVDCLLGCCKVTLQKQTRLETKAAGAMVKTSCRLQIPFTKWGGEGTEAFTAIKCYEVFLGNQSHQYEMNLQQFGNCFFHCHQEAISDAFLSWPWNLVIIYFNEELSTNCH